MRFARVHLLDPSAAGSGLSPNDFHVTLTSIADGYTIPQVLTHAQLLQTDDNVVIESACFNMETDQGFETAVYEESYKCVAPCSGQTVTSIAAPWTRGPGCGSETRDDHPDMSCDVNGALSWSPNNSSSTCGVFARANFQFTSELLYTPIITPAHTGNAANGQPWLYNWLYAEWFFRSDSFRTTIVPTISTTQLWTDDYVGGAVPETNAVNLFPFWMGAFYGISNTDWDSAKPWDPADLPANIDGIDLDGVRGEAQPGRQWRWTLWERDTDATFGYTPITNPASGGVSYDDLNLVYHQYHAEAQTAVCAASDAPGRFAFDQLTYAGCAGGVMNVSVFDGNGAGPVTATVASAGTGDSDTLILSGSSPRWTWQLPYSLAGGVDPGDGVLFVTPDDTVLASYLDDVPVAEATAFAQLGCVAGEVVIEGVVAVDDTANSGDGDGIPDTNEIVDFTIAIRNDGRADLSNVVVTISSTDPDVDCINEDSATIAAIAAAAGSASNDLVTDPFTFKVSDATECADASNPPTATFDVFVRADTMDGMTRPQKFTFDLDLDALGSTVLLLEDFDGSAPAGWTHQVGPGDDDGVIGVGAAGLTCGPYVDQWFWNSTGGVTGGGFFCWGNPADSFPNGTYADNLDSVLESATVTMPASGTRATLSFDHEYKFADADSSGGGRFALDGVVVHYSVNGGPWTKVTDLAYDAELFFNTYCNPECNGGDELFDASPPTTQDCFHEYSGLGERVFNALGGEIQDWITASAEVWGLHAGDQVRFRWRAGSMNSAALGLGTSGGYGLDNVQVDAGLFECDTTVRPDKGCVAASVPAPPVGDGVSVTMMLASRGASADDVDMTFDAATCSGDRAVVMYGNLGNFGAYQGAVASGCDAGSSGAASFTQSGSYWSNVVWVNADEAAGHPGESTAGPRAWTAAGFCAVATDDTSDAVCD